MNSGRRLAGRSTHAKPLGWWTVWGLQLLGGRGGPISLVYLLIHESPLTDALFLLVSKSDEVTTT